MSRTLILTGALLLAAGLMAGMQLWLAEQYDDESDVQFATTFMGATGLVAGMALALTLVWAFHARFN